MRVYLQEGGAYRFTSRGRTRVALDDGTELPDVLDAQVDLSFAEPSYARPFDLQLRPPIVTARTVTVSFNPREVVHELVKFDEPHPLDELERWEDPIV